MEIKCCRVYDRICKELFVLNFQSSEMPSIMSFIVNNWHAWAVQLEKNIVQLQRKSKRIGELDRETLAYPPYFSNYLQYNLNGEEFSNYEDVKTGWENIVTQNERTKGF